MDRNMLMKIACNGVLLLSLAAVSGCGSLIAGGVANGGGQGADDTRSVSERNTDAAITAAINRKYVQDSRIDALDIRVYTHRGVVTLTGSVSSQAVASRAVAQARATASVRRVVSRLSVRD
jgi:hyperosmotically inducible protein